MALSATGYSVNLLKEDLSKFFPFRADPFQKEINTQEQTGSHKVVSLIQNGGKSTRVEFKCASFALDPCSCGRSSLSTGIQGKIFAFILHF